MERDPNRHNWAAAFLEYLNASSFAEVSSLLGIPLHRVTRRARDERWAKLVNNLTPPALDSPGDDREKTIERIQQNRERNFAVAQKMQADVLEQVDKLCEGSLIVKRQTATGQMIELPPGLRDAVVSIGCCRRAPRPGGDQSVRVRRPGRYRPAVAERRASGARSLLFSHFIRRRYHRNNRPLLNKKLAFYPLGNPTPKLWQYPVLSIFAV